MNFFCRRRIQTSQFAGTLLIILWAWAGGASNRVAEAQTPFVLVDQNSSVTLEPTKQATMFRWDVDQYNHLNELSNWYRPDGATDEASLHTFLSVTNPPVASDSTGDSIDDTLTVTYDLPQFQVVIEFGVTGGPQGSGYSSMGERIWITNLTSSNRRFHLFEYFDLDLTDTPGDDTIMPLSKSTFTQYDSVTTVSGGVIDADHYEDTYLPTTINKLQFDGVPSNLSDVPAIGVPEGPGNVAMGLQWNFIGIAPPRPLIPAHQTVFIDKRFECQSIVPEPVSGMLMLVGMLGLIGVRRGVRLQSR
jgi:hypothetical protein